MTLHTLKIYFDNFLVPNLNTKQNHNDFIGIDTIAINLVSKELG